MATEPHAARLEREKTSTHMTAYLQPIGYAWLQMRHNMLQLHIIPHPTTRVEAIATRSSGRYGTAKDLPIDLVNRSWKSLAVPAYPRLVHRGYTDILPS